jgi:hypothetical protein
MQREAAEKLLLKELAARGLYFSASLVRVKKGFHSRESFAVLPHF